MKKYQFLYSATLSWHDSTWPSTQFSGFHFVNLYILRLYSDYQIKKNGHTMLVFGLFIVQTSIFLLVLNIKHFPFIYKALI